ncbi:MAG: hydroxymethylglutaryl-CoA synthase family protein [Candidatus Aenigmarchaeota archaeon]|nr:hydroxymethylglutaryl-CoA synthase family protein [Candidatus Aenigmarchaeota archaeon]
MTEAARQNKCNVGMDFLEVEVSGLYLSSERFSENRKMYDKDGRELTYDEKVGLMQKGIGVDAFGVPDYHVDSATLVMNGAVRAIEKYKIDPRKIDAIVLGTETPLYHSKPIASMVLGAIEERFDVSLKNCFAIDYNFACASAGYALRDSLARISSGIVDDDKIELVCSTDISSYFLEKPGEKTRGLVATVAGVKKNPRALKIEPIFGVATSDNRDFFRPVSDENGMYQAEAIVDGKYSEQQYLSHMRDALDNYIEKYNNLIEKGEKPELGEKLITDDIEFIVAHAPFPGMVKKAYLGAFNHLRRGRKEYDAQLLAEVGRVEPRIEKCDSEAEFMKEHNDFMRALSKAEMFRNELARKVVPGLKQLRRIGNGYTGQVHTGLYSTLYNATTDITGSHIGGVYYGSGSTAIVGCFEVLPGYIEIKDKMDLDERLDARQEVEFPQYLSAVSKDKPNSFFEDNPHISRMTESIVPPKKEFAFIGIEKEEHNIGLRKYKWFD